MARTVKRGARKTGPPETSKAGDKVKKAPASSATPGVRPAPTGGGTRSGPGKAIEGKKRAAKTEKAAMASRQMKEKKAPAWTPEGQPGHEKPGTSVGDFLGNQDEKGNVQMSSYNPSTVGAGTLEGGVADLHVIAFPDYGTKEGDSPEVVKAKEDFRAEENRKAELRRQSSERERNMIASNPKTAAAANDLTAGMEAYVAGQDARKFMGGNTAASGIPKASTPDVTIPPGERPKPNPARVTVAGTPGGGFVPAPKDQIHSSMMEGTPHPPGKYQKKKISPGGIGKM